MVDVVLAWNDWFGMYYPKLNETLAIWYDLHISFSKVLLEFDCLQAVSLLNNESYFLYRRNIYGLYLVCNFSKSVLFSVYYYKGLCNDSIYGSCEWCRSSTLMKFGPMFGRSRMMSKRQHWRRTDQWRISTHLCVWSR